MSPWRERRSASSAVPRTSTPTYARLAVSTYRRLFVLTTTGRLSPRISRRCSVARASAAFMPPTSIPATGTPSAIVSFLELSYAKTAPAPTHSRTRNPATSTKLLLRMVIRDLTPGTRPGFNPARAASPRSGASEVAIDGPQHVAAGPVAGLVPPELLEVLAAQRRQDGQHLLGPEVVVGREGRVAVRARADGPRCPPVLHAGAPAQELLDLALVDVALLAALEERRGALMLAQLGQGLAGGVAVLVTRRLELAVVEPAAVAELAEHLGRDPHAERTQDSVGHRVRPPGRDDRQRAAVEQVEHLGEDEDAVGGRVVDAGDVARHDVVEHPDHVVLVDELVAGVEAEDRRHEREREHPSVRRFEVGPDLVRRAEDRRRALRTALGEVGDGALGLDDVLLEQRPRRVRATHLRGEERRVVLLAAVQVRGGLEDERPHPRVRRRAAGEDVHRPYD